jgi:CheY-like chemotaxis protein
MDGWDVLKGIRSRAETLLTPVFILSALPQSDPRNGICNELADAYIQKPFSPPELIAMIDRRLGHLNTEQRQDVLQWRKMRFGGELTAQVAAEHLAGHYVGIQKEAYGVLAEMGAAAIPALTQVATSEAESGWFYALQLLGSRKEEEATLALAKLLTHPDRQRRWAALATIGALSADGALQAVVEHGQPVFDEIVAALDSPDERLQAEAIRTLQRIRTPEAMRTLQDFAGRVSGAALELAAMALRWMGRA